MKDQHKCNVVQVKKEDTFHSYRDHTLSATMPVTTIVQQICTGCLTPIEDRYMLKVKNESWHETCLQCALCRVSLTGSCFSGDGKLYCKHDYETLYATRCTACHQTTSPHELVMKLDNHVFHLQCFSCVVCRLRLQKGQQFVFKEAQLFCWQHYDAGVNFHAISPRSDTSECCYDDVDSGDLDINNGPKRPRTILTTSQRRKFKASFEINPKPARKMRESLAAETGLTVRVVQVWFQNQRAKMKKLARKQNTENKDHGRHSNNTHRGICDQGNSSSSSNSSKETPKFPDNKQEGDSDFSDSGADKPSGDGAVFVIPGSCMSGLQDNPLVNNFPLYDMSSQPDMYSSSDSGDLFYSETPLDVNDGIDHFDLVLKSLRPSQHGSEVVTSNSTPIDKLYSMQMSYFCSE